MKWLTNLKQWWTAPSASDIQEDQARANAYAVVYKHTKAFMDLDARQLEHYVAYSGMTDMQRYMALEKRIYELEQNALDPTK